MDDTMHNNIISLIFFPSYLKNKLLLKKLVHLIECSEKSLIVTIEPISEEVHTLGINDRYIQLNPGMISIQLARIIKRNNIQIVHSFVENIKLLVECNESVNALKIPIISTVVSSNLDYSVAENYSNRVVEKEKILELSTLELLNIYKDTLDNYQYCSNNDGSRKIEAQYSYTLKKSIKKQIKMNSLIYLPKDYSDDSSKKWPLIVFLHGSWERGEGNLAILTKHGIPKIVEKRMNFPFITLSPQCPKKSWWSMHITELTEIINDVEKKYRVDTDRIYLTGFSMGGIGAWHLALTHPEKFAAVVPICASGIWYLGFPERVTELKEVPIWIFHGEKDKVVPIDEAESIAAVLEKCSTKYKYTVIPDSGHNIWEEIYDSDELYDWFLEQSKNNGGIESENSINSI